MLRRNLILALAAFFMISSLTACTGNNTDLTNQIRSLEERNSVLLARVSELEAEVERLQEELLGRQQSASLLLVALEVVEHLSQADMASVAVYVHPDGLRFSPYGYVDPAQHLNFQAQDVALLMSNSTVFTWGAYDGTGYPIDLIFADYYARFVYDADFAWPEYIGINAVIGVGNTLINHQDIYPGSSFVEFHFSGLDPQYEGMDWRSLRLVFEDVQGQWKLRAIVHDEWTI